MLLLKSSSRTCFPLHIGHDAGVEVPYTYHQSSRAQPSDPRQGFTREFPPLHTSGPSSGPGIPARTGIEARELLAGDRDGSSSSAAGSNTPTVGSSQPAPSRPISPLPQSNAAAQTRSGAQEKLKSWASLLKDRDTTERVGQGDGRHAATSYRPEDIGGPANSGSYIDDRQRPMPSTARYSQPPQFYRPQDARYMHNSQTQGVLSPTRSNTTNKDSSQDQTPPQHTHQGRHTGVGNSTQDDRTWRHESERQAVAAAESERQRRILDFEETREHEIAERRRSAAAADAAAEEERSRRLTELDSIRSEDQWIRRRNQTAAVAAAEQERSRRMEEQHAADAAAATERLQNQSWASRQIQEEHHRRAQEQEEQLEQMHEVLTENIMDYMTKLNRVRTQRRKGRARLLERLSSVVESIWETGHIVIYGSCYTGLDLPSSDVDIVVCGVGTATVQAPAVPPMPPMKADPTSESVAAVVAAAAAAGAAAALGPQADAEAEVAEGADKDSGNVTTHLQVPTPAHHGHHTGAADWVTMNRSPPPLELSPERMMTISCIQRLAAALSDMKWVVTIKTIETASIPVIKMLVDTGEPTDMEEEPDEQDRWRGHNIDHGLVPVDISFEGSLCRLHHQNRALRIQTYLRGCV